MLLSQIVLTDGAFDPSKVILTLDGGDVTLAAAVTQSMSFPATHGTILYTPPSDLSLGPHQGILTYPSTDGPLTRTWNFNVASIACPGASGH